MSARIEVCVVHHEGVDKLSACLHALRAQSHAFARIVVIDDASADGSVEWLESHHPDVEVVRLDRRCGPAVARNEGYRKGSAPLVLFVDNDVRLSSGCVEALVGALDATGALVAMPRVLRAADPSLLDFEGAEGHWLGQMIPRGAGAQVAGRSMDVRDCGSVITACFLLDRERWGRAPLFNESLPFNYEDHEFGVRARILGHDLIAVPEAQCLHGDGTPGASVRGKAAYPPVRVRSLVRGRWQVLSRLYQLRSLVVLAPVLGLFELVQLVGCIKRGWFRFWLAEVVWAVSHLPRTLSERHDLQRRRANPDRDVFVGGPLPWRRALPSTGAEQRALALVDRIVAGYLRWVGRAS